MADEERQERQPLLDSQNQNENQNNGKQKHIVEFDPNGDEDNPMEWTKKYRWVIVFFLSFMATTVTFTCVGIVPVAGSVVEDLEGQKDKSVAVLFVTIWELGEAAGPLFIAPLSEIFGRYPIYNAANILFIGGIVLSALSQDVNLLVFSRFLTGCAVATNVLNPAIVGDLYPSDSRGSPMSIVMLAPLIGGAVGPSIAGALAQATNWRVIMWLAVGLACVCELVFLLYFRETYKATILMKRAKRYRRETGDESYKTEHDKDAGNPIWTILQSMLRPAKVLFSSSVLALLSLWGALVFSFFYTYSTTLPDMLQDEYGFDPAMTGVAFLTFSAGSMSGIAICNLFVDRIYNKLEKKHGNFFPEGRLPIPVFAAFLLVPTVALYGWAPELHLHVSVLMIAVVLIGVCVVLGIVPMMTYVTDAFGLYSASALTAVLIARCLAGTFLPLAVAPLTDVVGDGWGFTIMAGVCLLMAPVPFLVYKFGADWRQKSWYSMDKE